LKVFLQSLADVIFPPTCLSCETVLHEGGTKPFCEACAEKISPISPPLCTLCGSPFPAPGGIDHVCGDCLKEPPSFDLARSAGRYDGPLLEAIHRFKYRSRTTAGVLLGRWMAARPWPGFRPADYDLLLPVPLHAGRLRQRGFNQAVILGRAVAASLSIPFDTAALQRGGHRDPQVGLGRRERRANVRGAFVASLPGRIAGKNIVLLDDVYTTGSTVRECARVLKKAGAAGVAVLTLARAVDDGVRGIETEDLQ